MKKYLKSLSHTRYLFRRLEYNFLSKAIRGGHFNVVLDIGCGRAPYKKLISFDRYICLDVEKRSDSIGEILLADINKGIPIESETIDLIICTEVLEHLKEPFFALKEMRRILKGGGKLILTVPFLWPLHEEPNDYFRYSEYGLKYLLRAAGFDKIEIKPSNNFLISIFQILNINLKNKIFFPLVVLFNLFGRLSEKVESNYKLPLFYQIKAK